MQNRIELSRIEYNKNKREYARIDIIMANEMILFGNKYLFINMSKISSSSM